MKYVTYVLSIVGISAYAGALFNIGSSLGETLSDVGSGCMLIAILAMLFHVRVLLKPARNLDER